MSYSFPLKSCISTFRCKWDDFFWISPQDTKCFWKNHWFFGVDSYLFPVSFQCLKTSIVSCFGFLAEKTCRKLTAPKMIGYTFAALSMLAARICTRTYHWFVMLTIHIIIFYKNISIQWILQALVQSTAILDCKKIIHISIWRTAPN